MATLSVGPDSLAALARRPGLAAAFPFLNPLTRPAAGGCGGCGAARPRAAGWRAASDALFSLSKTRQAEFKIAAGVETVTRRVVRGGRVTVQSF